MKRRKFLQVISAVPVVVAVPLLAQRATKQTGQGSPEVPSSSAPPGPSMPPGSPSSSPISPASVLKTTFFETELTSVPKFFTSSQFAALRRLSKSFVPPMNGKPGAVEAGAAEFLDFYTSVSLPDRQELYRTGLDNLNAQAESRFRKSFGELTDTEADSILKPMLKPRGSSGGFQAFLELGPFVNRAYQDIRTVTRNSPAWAENARAAGIDVLTPLCWTAVDPTLPLYHRIDAIATDKKKRV